MTEQRDPFRLFYLHLPPLELHGYSRGIQCVRTVKQNAYGQLALPIFVEGS